MEIRLKAKKAKRNTTF